ncbi:hypothetical protein GCM10009825_32860 [Arthrobacter humicola]|uniref:Uncharacterized protein n=1 Tax=Arthrobacter humicola TaxID=409291 RepID=A0ABP5L7S0_9MICC
MLPELEPEPVEQPARAMTAARAVAEIVRVFFMSDLSFENPAGNAGVGRAAAQEGGAPRWHAEAPENQRRGPGFTFG